MRERGGSEMPCARLRPAPGRGLRAAAAASRAPRCAALRRAAAHSLRGRQRSEARSAKRVAKIFIGETPFWAIPERGLGPRS
jgi:hypothetical protein